ncbi:restriction modification system DNA specificity domain containing protein [Lactobacillus pasteurii DSM 23907 = CRBIP 24.76]|uniref:VirA n=1 Tax=Lactobacillus pasteurii DSM 23907 = CRBIP 24.76 TaxID=1423790 RepID=I7KKR9_9LACO|nr:restriction endonuclease subunit S [Lactobacillus pasteurii]KRK07429.1 restriction modification system DNA specificity domain containing protein [Lactobacillus pasteurii DSM 23907 = CRBIP 24.76]TDG77630.1 hypothetical protein C5L33_000041 [Lactobacillus pasteurii]CCI84744.1 VirA [Lactobacillus pasteurii DSM 23907 = CRBIP 24.76]
MSKVTMMEKNNGIPKLRFPGFTDPWEQRKLGDFFKKYQNKIFLDDTTKYIQISVRNTGKVEYRTTNYGKNIGRKRQYLVDTKNYPDTLTFTRQTVYEGGIGYIPSSLNGAIVTENMPLLAKNSKIDKNFSKILFKTHLYYHNVIEKNKPIGSAQKALHEKVWLESVVTVPTLLEQQKIGEFFKQLDSLIALHQRKLDHLKEKKRGLLQKMFPKNGEVVPELRFPGFTDPWEQRKVGYYLKKSTVSGSNGTVAKKLTVKLWGKGVVQKETITQGSSNTKYYKRSAGQLMYGKLDFLHAAFGIVPKKLDGYESTADSPAFDVVNGDSRFLLENFLRRDFYLQNGEKANGSRRAKRIHENVFLNMEIYAPNTMEQRAISDFLQQLDTLISLHQRKLDHLKEMKKALLQQMFI